MNPALNKQLHGLLTQTGLKEQKAALVSSFTDGRSDSSKDLTNDEAKQMIAYLNTKATEHGEAANKMRRKIISLAHEMHWQLSPSGGAGGGRIDMQRLNAWCVKFSYLKKELNKYTYVELTKLVTQFTAVYNSYLHNL